MRTFQILALLAVLFFPAAPGRAQDFLGGGGGMVASMPETDPVTVTVQAATDVVRPGDQAVIAVVFDHADEYHINLNQPVVPEEMAGFVPPSGGSSGPSRTRPRSTS